MSMQGHLLSDQLRQSRTWSLQRVLFVSHDRHISASGTYGVSDLCLHSGDKPGTFVGSKQWIGAIELGYILETLQGVSCKVITVSSGADMPSKAREIAHHFDTQVLQPPHKEQ